MARFVVPAEFLLIANTSNKKARCFLDAIKRLVNTQSFFIIRVQNLIDTNF